MPAAPAKAERQLDESFGICERLDVASKLSACLAREMKAHEWSYADLAEKLGTSKSQAHDWVNGAHEPNLQSIRHIAKTLDLDLAELIGAA